MENKTNRFYAFGGFRLNARERSFTRDGEAVALTPKAFDLLVVLVEHRGELLHKETLLKAVWPDSFVEENNLADNIFRLRKVLGEGENGAKFIETVPKHGYRFVAEVREEDDALPAAALLAPVAVQSAAVRPSFLLVAVALVPVFIGAAIWLDAWVKKKAEVYRLQVSGDFYATKWTEPEVRKGIQYYDRLIALDPRSLPAYEGLAIGWNFLSDLHLAPREAMPKAKDAALKALAIDETSAGAHISLGLVKLQYEWNWAGAEAEFKRAIEIAPKYSPGHRLYGWYWMSLGRFEKSKAELQSQLEANPLDDTNLWELGLSYYFARQYDQALEQYRRAIGVEANSHWPHMLLGWAFAQQGKFTEAITAVNEALRLNDNPQVRASLGYAYALAGRRADAEKIVAQLTEASRRRYVSPYDVATVHAALGDKERAFTWLEKAMEDRSGWLPLWLKVDPKFDILHADARFRDLLTRVGHTR